MNCHDADLEMWHGPWEVTGHRSRAAKERKDRGGWFEIQLSFAFSLMTWCQFPVPQHTAAIADPQLRHMSEVDVEREPPFKGKFSYFYESTNSYIYESTSFSPRRRKRRTGNAKEESTGWECQGVGWLSSVITLLVSEGWLVEGGGEACRLD